MPNVANTNETIGQRCRSSHVCELVAIQKKIETTLSIRIQTYLEQEREDNRSKWVLRYGLCQVRNDVKSKEIERNASVQYHPLPSALLRKAE